MITLRPYPYIFCLICFPIILSCEKDSTPSARKKSDESGRHAPKDAGAAGSVQQTLAESPDSGVASAAQLDRLKLAIQNFTEETNLAARDYEQYDKWLIELAEMFPSEACQLLASGSIDMAYKSKVSMFSALLANPDKLGTIALLEGLAKARGVNPDGSETATALSEALGKATKDPAYAGVIKSLFTGEDAGTHISYFFKEAGKASGAELANHLDEFGLSGRDRDLATMSIALSVARQDQHAALDLLDSLDPGFAGSTYGEIVLQLLETDRASAQELFLDLDDVKLQRAVRHPYLLQALVKPENIGLLQNVLQRFVVTNDSAPTFEKLINGMAALDRPEAARILDRLPESSSRSTLIQDLWRGTGAGTLEEAMSAISRLPESSTVGGTRGIVRSLAESDQEAAFQLVRKSPKPMQSILVADVIEQSIGASPTNAGSTFVREMKSGRLGLSEALPVAGRISFATANHNVLQAVTWAENLPPDCQPAAFQGLMESWGKSDPVRASKWLADVPEGPGRDAGARALVREIESTDSVMAAKWKATFEK